MSRKVFISFLGTGNYKECKYVSKEKGESSVVTYVQDAIVDLFCSDFTVNDKVYIFLTEEAESKHWAKLKNVLEPKVEVEAIKNIPQGYTENDIWTIFERVFNVLEEEDEIILDVTHGFRSLPMLQIVLLNYAKALKKVKIKAILYGAFEALGPAYKIEEIYPNPEDRYAPILNLTSFSVIQEWAFGAKSFVKTGKTSIITELSMENITPILKETQGKDETALSLRNVMNNLSQIDATIRTNRGKLIQNGEYVSNANKILIDLVDNNDTVFTPIKPILNQINQKLSDFNEMDHWLASVKWCIEHELIQQGITQFQEGIISIICDQYQLDSENHIHRKLVPKCFNIQSRNIQENEWELIAKKHSAKVREIIKSDLVQRFNSQFSSLTELRNDINHGGYGDKAISDGKTFKKRLEKLFNEFIEIKTHAPESL